MIDCWVLATSTVYAYLAKLNQRSKVRLPLNSVDGASGSWTSGINMQQWSASMPRCLGVSDAAVEPTLLLNYGECDTFERNPTVWEDSTRPPVRDSCMYSTTISHAVVPSCQHQHYYDTLSAPAASYVSSPSSTHLKYPAHTATVSSTFTDALLVDEQQEHGVLQSPEAPPYSTSPMMDDGSVVEHSGKDILLW